MSTIATLTIEMAANIARLQADMDQAKRVVGDSMRNIETALGYAKTAFVAFAGVASVGAFAGMIHGSIEAAAKLNDLAAQTGASVEALSALGSVGKTTDTSVEMIGAAMNKLAKNMAGATEDTKGTGQAIEALGIDFQAFKALSPDEQMQTVAKAMNEFADGSGKSAVAMALYGKEGAKLIPFLKDLAETGELAAKVTSEQAAMADNFSDNLVKLKVSGEGWKKELSMGMLPALNDATQALLDATNSTGGLRDGLRELSRNGTIADWTRAGITGLTYLIDVIEALWRVIQRLYLETKADFDQLSAIFTGFTKSVSLASKGFFNGAKDAMAKGMSDAAAVAVKAQQDIEDAWNKPLLGAQIRTRMEEVKNLGATAQEAKPKLDFTNVMAKNKEGADKQTKAYADLVASIREKIAATKLETESGGKLTEAQKLQLDINKQVEKGTITLKDATSDKTRALIADVDAAERAKVAQETLHKINEEVWKDYLKQNDVLQKNAQAIDDKVRKQLEENEAIGKTKSEILQLEITRLREQAATMGQIVQQEELLGLCTRETVAHKDTLDALNKLIKAKEQGVHLQAAKESADAWEKTAKTVETSLTDALMRGFEAGKGFGASMRDALVNLFKTLILRPIIQPIAQMGANSVLGALGMGSAGTAAASTGNAPAIASSGGSGIGGFLGSQVGLFGSGFSSGLTAWGAEGSVMGLLGQGSSLFAGGIANGLGTIAGALGPIALGLGAVYGIVKSMDDSGTLHSGGVGSYSATTGALTGRAADAFVGFDQAKLDADWVKSANDGAVNLSKGIVGMLDNISGIFGKTTGFTAGTGFQDDTSKDGAWGALKIALGGKTLLDWSQGQDKWPGREFSDGQMGVAEYSAALAADVRAVLAGVGLPQWATQMLNALGNSPTLEQLDAAVQYIVKFQTSMVSINSFGGAFSTFATASDSARVAIVDLVGGIDALMQKASSFVGNYYSQAEQGGLNARLIEQGLKDAGFTADQIGALSSRADYRALLESVNPNSEMGQQQFAALLNLQGTFASVSSIMAEQKMTLADLAKQAPTVAALDKLLAPSQNTAQATQNVATGVATSNTLLAVISDKLDAIGAAADAAVSSAAASAAAASAAADRASLAVAQPSYAYDMGR